MGYTMSQYEEAAAYIRSMTGQAPEIGVVLGSGLGTAFDHIEDAVVMEYGDIPHFPTSTVESHAGKLIFCEVEGKTVLAMSGRFHYYEGYSMGETAFPVRVMKLLGIRTVVLTNAAGALNESFQVGEFMLIRDHIKFFNDSPVRGEIFPVFGQRFFDMSNVYTDTLREDIKEFALQSGIILHEGIYAYMPGPQFETPAEIRMLQRLGADAVGMSTVAEAITAASCSMKVAAVSCLTNMGAGIEGNPITDDEVVEVANRVREEFKTLLMGIIKRI